MTLPFDIARCPGNGSPICEQCARREPGNEWQWYIEPMACDGACEHAIPPRTKDDQKARQTSPFMGRKESADSEAVLWAAMV